MVDSSQRLLVTQDIERAMLRQEFEHPLLDILDKHTFELLAFRERYGAQKDPQAHQDCIEKDLGFFVDAVEQVSNFSFGPLDMVAVWSKIDDLQLPGRYNLTRAVALAYITIPLPSRLGSNRYFLESKEFPPGLFTSAVERGTSEVRLKQVQDSLNEIQFYRYGVRKTFSELLKGMTSPEGIQLVNKVKESERNSPLKIRLHELYENFSNGITPLQAHLQAYEL